MYPVGSEDQRNLYRHHFESFRLDTNVAALSMSEDSESPSWVRVAIDFIEGQDQPANASLRFMNMVYPERATPVREQNPWATLVPPNVDADVAHWTRQLTQALHVPALLLPEFGSAMTDLGNAMSGTEDGEDVPIPDWVRAGHLYQWNEDPTLIVQLAWVVRGSLGLVVAGIVPHQGTIPPHWKRDLDGNAIVPLEGFVAEFKPRDIRRPTAWERILEEDD